MTKEPKCSLYEELAAEIARQIATNVLRPGDRLPSIRQTCKARHLSPSTVFQAYDLLESRGLIRAAPRSGYFVNPPSERAGSGTRDVDATRRRTPGRDHRPGITRS